MFYSLLENFQENTEEYFVLEYKNLTILFNQNILAIFGQLASCAAAARKLFSFAGNGLWLCALHLPSQVSWQGSMVRIYTIYIVLQKIS